MRRRLCVAAALLPPLAGRAVPPADAAAAQATALKRLEDVVQQQVSRRKGRGAIDFRTAVLEPDGSRITWGRHSVRSNVKKRLWRVAIDTRTRWFYIAQFDADRLSAWYGPLDETAQGRFEDVETSLPR